MSNKSNTRNIRIKERFSIVNCMGQDSSNTHHLKPYKDFYNFAMTSWIRYKDVVAPNVVDPFARTCLWGTIRNDINPLFFQQNMTTHCMDALEFMCELETNSAHIILFDPPFSDRQSNEEYGTSNLYTNPGYISDLGLQFFRVLKPKGYLIKCGYNTNAPYKGFKLLGVKIANMGASRNDILFSIWQNQQTDWHDYI